MQLVFSFRNAAIGTALIVAGYYGYRGFVADVRSDDMTTLLSSHRRASVAQRMIFRRRVLAVYDRDRDRAFLVRCLDSPSPITQSLAVEVLAAKREYEVLPKLRAMLEQPERDNAVQAELAKAMGAFRHRAAIPRLIELTDNSEDHDVRMAAHTALQTLTGAGAEIKFGDAARQHWSLWWRDHHQVVSR